MIDKATQPNHELLNFLSRTTSFLCAGIRTFTYHVHEESIGKRFNVYVIVIISHYEAEQKRASKFR